MKHEVNAMGKQCPIPVVMTKKVIDNAAVGDEIEILIDNETAVNNLSRLANKTGCTFVSEKLGDKKYQVKMAVKTEQTGGTLEEEEFVCEAPHKKVTVAVISSNVMGNGDDELGKILIKGFIYALSQMETHPDTILFYNGGAKLTTEDSESLEDLKKMEEETFAKIIMGKADISEFDTFVENWKNQGGDQILKEINEELNNSSGN